MWLIAVTVLALAPYTAGAQSPGIVRGKVIDATTGGAVSGATVELSRFEGNPPALVSSTTTTTSANGSYRFEGLDTTGGIVWVTSVTYQGVLYSSGMIRFQDGEDQQRDLTVYDTTTDPSGLGVSSRGLVISGIDSSTGQLSVVDIFALRLTGSRALGPNADGRTVRFAVPDSALEVTPMPGFDFGTPSIESAIVYSSAPLAPGDSSASLGYTLPYTGNSVAFDLKPLYQTDAVRILIPVSGGEFTNTITLTGQGFTAGGVVTVGNRDYQLWSSGAIAADQPLQVRIGNLPPFEPKLNRLRSFEPAVVAVIALLLATGLTVWVVMKRGLHRSRPVMLAPVLGAPLEERRAELAERLRTLEREHADGELDERTYAAERRGILEQLRQLSRQARGIGDDE